jgi:hypothetical protein
MPRFSALLGILAIVLTACGGASAAGPGGSAPASPIIVGTRPAVDLRIEGGSAAGAWPADPKAPLATCQHLPDGSWVIQYTASGPTVELYVGAHAGEPGHANELALQIDADGGFLWADDAGYRKHDPVGRNHMTVAMPPATGGTAFVVTGTTPYHEGYDDVGTATVTLTATCPA